MRTANSGISKLPNCNLAISNVEEMRMKTTKRVEKISINFQIFKKANKIDVIDNKNLDASCLNYRKLHLNGKGHSYFQNNGMDYLDCESQEDACQFIIAPMLFRQKNCTTRENNTSKI